MPAVTTAGHMKLNWKRVSWSALTDPQMLLGAGPVGP